MFRPDNGAVARLQLSADLLCDSAPLHGLWKRRAAKMTGYRVYRRSRNRTESASQALQAEFAAVLDPCQLKVQ
jgi:hypothetical protein